jgi:fucose 4-O-acetylase-like acetyltransferase
MNTLRREYLPFVDWMKALGITIIVIGHVAARPINGLTPPIYPKQLGVAFFIFVLGYSLARERRAAAQVIYNRAFEVYLVGIPIAVLMTLVTFLQRGTLALGNYLPFALGANVLFDHFPPNPTTWYIGTYVHVLLLWALFARSRQVRPWMLAVSLPVEILVRAFLVGEAGNFIAYMLFSNWASVFLLGAILGQAPPKANTGTRGRSGIAVPAAALGAMIVVWPLLMDRTVVERTFPFMKLGFGLSQVDAVLTSACVSGLYLVMAWLVFLVTRQSSTPTWVRFLARNTLIVFIAHMPVFFLLDALLSTTIPAYGPRSMIHVVVGLPGLALLSEGVWRVVRPRALRDTIAAHLFGASPVRP